MAIATMSVNAVSFMLGDGDNITPVSIELGGRRDSSQEIAIRFKDLGHMCDITFCVVDGVLQMVTRNYQTGEDKPVVVKLHKFTPTP